VAIEATSPDDVKYWHFGGQSLHSNTYLSTHAPFISLFRQPPLMRFTTARKLIIIIIYHKQGDYHKWIIVSPMYERRSHNTD
jgi:hypothetical protein